MWDVLNDIVVQSIQCEMPVKQIAKIIATYYWDFEHFWISDMEMIASNLTTEENYLVWFDDWDVGDDKDRQFNMIGNIGMLLYRAIGGYLVQNDSLGPKYCDIDRFVGLDLASKRIQYAEKHPTTPYVIYDYPTSLWRSITMVEKMLLSKQKQLNNVYCDSTWTTMASTANSFMYYSPYATRNRVGLWYEYGGRRDNAGATWTYNQM